MKDGASFIIPDMEAYPHLARARECSARVRKLASAARRAELRRRCAFAAERIGDPGTAKIALSMLYLGEGSKSIKKSIVTFANADPNVISLFLRLFRLSFAPDEAKFRCTVQCRADQDAEVLQVFWSKVTEVPLHRFYRAQVDRRTVGKPTKKLGYMGVLRIDYLSSMVFNELLLIAETLFEGR